MTTLPSLDTFKLADADKPRVGLRVFVSGGDERYRNILRSRDPQADATTLTLQHHLTWRKESSPFVSLWTSWRRAVYWARSRAKSGGLDIDIAAVWIHDQDIYDAHDAATTLPMPYKKLPDYHRDEVIIVDRGGEVDFRIIARFPWVTERRWKMVTFDDLTEPSTTSLPIGPLYFEPRNDEERSQDMMNIRWRDRELAALEDEVISNVGLKSDYAHIAVHLVRVLCKEPCSTDPVPVLLPTRQDAGSDKLVARFAELDL